MVTVTRARLPSEARARHWNVAPGWIGGSFGQRTTVCTPSWFWIPRAMSAWTFAWLNVVAAVATLLTTGPEITKTRNHSAAEAASRIQSRVRPAVAPDRPGPQIRPRGEQRPPGDPGAGKVPRGPERPGVPVGEEHRDQAGRQGAEQHVAGRAAAHAAQRGDHHGHREMQ